MKKWNVMRFWNVSQKWSTLLFVVLLFMLCSHQLVAISKIHLERIEVTGRWFRSRFLVSDWQVSKHLAVSKNGVPSNPWNFNRVVHYFHHPFWGTPVFGNTHFCCLSSYWLVLFSPHPVVSFVPCSFMLDTWEGGWDTGSSKNTGFRKIHGGYVSRLKKHVGSMLSIRISQFFRCKKSRPNAMASR